MENMYTLITGASSGIGRAFALEYGRRGQNLIITARSGDKLQELKREIEKDNQVSIECIIMDLAAEGSAKLLYEEIRKRKLHVDVLINNAGFATKGLFHKTDYKRQHEEMLLNIVSLTELTYLLLEDMCQKRHGTVINIASAASFNPLPYSAVYAATKAYVLSLTQALSFEYQDYGVKLLAVCPGATDTHFFDGFKTAARRLRMPEDVVRTTEKALKKGKSICTDGTFCKAQMLLSRIASRKSALGIMGKTGRKTWG